jgi:1-acyl-sn-glycerol-3-phosphate acyltransferase
MDVPAVGDALPKRGNRLSQLIAQSFMSIFGWRIEADIPNRSKLVLVGAPHTSNWDFVLTMATLFSLNVKIFWMGKRSLFKWPIGGVMEWLGGVPIDRASQGVGIVEQTIEAFNSRDEFVIAIMPEATRSKVREWKTGFYHIAQGAEVPIVLVRFDYGRKVMGIGPTIEPSGDVQSDIAQIRSHYEGIQGRNS